MISSTLTNFTPFKGPIQTWNGKEEYHRQKRILNKQIIRLISLQSGLGQSSQGMPEDWGYIKVLENDVSSLQMSIKNSLGIL